MLGMFKYAYIVVAAALFTLITFGKLFVFHKKEAVFVSDYTSSIALFLVLYVLLSLFAMVLNPVVFFAFAISPFALGFIAKYETEKYFTILQLLILVLSVVFIMEL